MLFAKVLKDADYRLKIAAKELIERKKAKMNVWLIM